MLGDLISSVATPVARMVGADCIDPQTNDLRPESPCAKAKQRLNNGENLFTVLYDRFFDQRTKGEKVKYLVQVEIETNKLSDIDLKAIEAAAKGDVIAANPRPTPPQPQQRPPIPAAARPITGTPQASA